MREGGGKGGGRRLKQRLLTTAQYLSPFYASLPGHMTTQKKKAHFPASLTARCGQVTKFHPTTVDKFLLLFSEGRYVTSLPPFPCFQLSRKKEHMAEARIAIWDPDMEVMCEYSREV